MVLCREILGKAAEDALAAEGGADAPEPAVAGAAAAGGAFAEAAPAAAPAMRSRMPPPEIVTSEIPGQTGRADPMEMQEMRDRMLICKQMLGGPDHDGEGGEERTPMASDERLQRDLLSKVAQRDSEIRALSENLKSLEKQETILVTAASATGGAAVVGVSGASAGLAVGGAVGAALGLAPAIFTLGLSIPVMAAVGAGCGALMGASTGAVAGAAGAGSVGYGVFTNRAELRDAVDSGDLKGFFGRKWRGLRA